MVRFYAVVILEKHRYLLGENFTNWFTIPKKLLTPFIYFMHDILVYLVPCGLLLFHFFIIYFIRNPSTPSCLILHLSSFKVIPDSFILLSSFRCTLLYYFPSRYMVFVHYDIFASSCYFTN